MKSALFALGFAAAAVAGPLGLLEKRTKPLCVKPAQAEKFMDRFINVLQHTDSDLGDYVTTAQAILTEDFQEISDSINMLANKPLGGVTADKSAYIVGAQHAPPTTGIETLGITVSNCDSKYCQPATHLRRFFRLPETTAYPYSSRFIGFIWEWNIKGVGKATYPVKGIGLFKIVRSGKWGFKVQASQLKLEFNNIAWGLDTGYGWVKQDGTLLGRAPNPSPAPVPSTTTPSETTTEETTTDDGTSNGEPVEETTNTTPEINNTETTT